MRQTFDEAGLFEKTTSSTSAPSTPSTPSTATSSSASTVTNTKSESKSEPTTPSTTTTTDSTSTPAPSTADATPAATATATAATVLPDISIPYVIIGAGTAAFSASKAIRERESSAKILIIGEEPDSPYMRTPLSKELWYSDSKLVKDLKFTDWNGKETTLHYRDPSFYTTPEELPNKEKGGVALLLGQRVSHLDVYRKFILLEDGRKVHFEKLLIATGGAPQNLPVLENDASLSQNITVYRKVSSNRRVFF